MLKTLDFELMVHKPLKASEGVSLGIIINPRGTGGSGKTELPRRILAEYGLGRDGMVKPLHRAGRERPIAYRLRHPLGGRLLGVLGHYERTSGGCDTISAADGGLDEIFRLTDIERTEAGSAFARVPGRSSGRPYKLTPAKLRLAQAAIGPPGTKVGDLCAELGITRQTLYRHVYPKGQLRPDGLSPLERQRAAAASVPTLSGAGR